MDAIIATTPEAMREAQPRVIDWCDKRIASARHELTLAEQTFNALQRVNARTHAASALIRKAHKRIDFYEKIKKALELGYVIVPPFQMQTFAIRTDRAPRANRSQQQNPWRNEQKPRLLPAGEANYRNPSPQREAVDSHTIKNKDGTTEDVSVYENVAWAGFDVPVRAHKPQIVDAIGHALEARIFDALGIAPHYRAADPVICGEILRPDGKGSVCFMVAWWLDWNDL